MNQVSSVLQAVNGGFFHWCPGCKQTHYIAVSKLLSNGAKWEFNGDLKNPTFSPSIRHHIPKGMINANNKPTCCHYFIKKGQIEFCGDCTHELAGQTIPLSPLTLKHCD